MDLLGDLHLDIMFQEYYVSKHLDVILRECFLKSKNTFCIMATKYLAYKVFMSDASLFVRKVKLWAPIIVGHTKKYCCIAWQSTQSPSRNSCLTGFIKKLSFFHNICTQ